MNFLEHIPDFLIQELDNTFGILLNSKIQKVGTNCLEIVDDESVTFNLVDKENIHSFDFAVTSTKMDSYYTGKTWFSKTLLRRIKKIIKGMNPLPFDESELNFYECAEKDVFPIIVRYGELYFLLAPKSPTIP